MHELQNAAAEKTERELNDRMNKLKKDMDEMRKQTILNVMKSFNHLVLKNSKLEIYAGVGSAILELSNDLDVMIPPFDLMQEGQLNKAAIAFLNICRDYFISKEDDILVNADEPLAHVELKTEEEGEQYWAASMARANAEWSANGGYRRSAEESHVEQLEGEEDTVLQYIKDQVCINNANKQTESVTPHTRHDNTRPLCHLPLYV